MRGAFSPPTLSSQYRVALPVKRLLDTLVASSARTCARLCHLIQRTAVALARLAAVAIALWAGLGSRWFVSWWVAHTQAALLGNSFALGRGAAESDARRTGFVLEVTVRVTLRGLHKRFNDLDAAAASLVDVSGDGEQLVPAVPTFKRITAKNYRLGVLSVRHSQGVVLLSAPWTADA